ncbi:hypothetical protein BsIDN1_34180 [Bacillus safensis]|uniref:Thiamine pyrophosphate enzyme N-terminal TPP-binding domain-containing protein n=1 Tax=Bacillus safensis TaxID=561879 RepID=A0A5S9M8A9_BACIA|nr:hypothetical protein BsIDN1_34180 [Bacillus safensis]
METIRLTMSQALVKFLNAQYVEFDGKREPFIKGIFTIFGHGNVVGIGQALQENPGRLEVYQGRNEQGMAHAAMAFAKQKHRKQIIACSSSVGPGSANMVTAAATATTSEPNSTSSFCQVTSLLLVSQIQCYNKWNKRMI